MEENPTKRRRCGRIRKISAVVMLAGAVILLTGLYYMIIKAGIPYQDPTCELQIQYGINAGIGDVLVKEGTLLMTAGGLIGFFAGKAGRKRTGA